MTYHCYSTFGTKSYKAVVWEYTTRQKMTHCYIVQPGFSAISVFQEDTDGVSVEDVSSKVQTKKLTTVHFGAVFDIKCSWPAAYCAQVHAHPRAQARCSPPAEFVHATSNLCVHVRAVCSRPAGYRKLFPWKRAMSRP